MRRTTGLILLAVTLIAACGASVPTDSDTIQITGATPAPTSIPLNLPPWTNTPEINALRASAKLPQPILIHVVANQTIDRTHLQAIIGAYQKALDQYFTKYYVKQPVKLVLDDSIVGNRMFVLIKPLTLYGQAAAGYHLKGSSGIEMYISTASKASLELLFGHELFEGLSDPKATDGFPDEIADKLTTRWFYIDGIPIQDFTLPNGQDLCSAHCELKCVTEFNDKLLPACRKTK